MAKREDVCDTEESCRQKASQRFESFKRGLRASHPEMDDFAVLKDICDRALYASRRSRENLEHGHHARHVAAPYMAVAFEGAVREAVEIMDLACAEMKTLRNDDGALLSRVNCTSQAFRLCVEDLTEERRQLPIIAAIIDEKILPLLPDSGPPSAGGGDAPALRLAS